jgi:hypothetical protein
MISDALKNALQNSVSDATIKWLQDAPAASAEALAALTAAPPDPEPPMPSDSPFDRPTNADQLKDCLQTAADEFRVAMLDPRTVIDLDKTVTIQQRSNDGSSWGVNGNHAHINWVGPWGEDMLVYQGLNGIANRQLFIEKLNLYGGGYEAQSIARFCLKVYAPDGDPGSIYKFTLRDIFTTYADYGIGIVGAVFEGLLDNCHGESHRMDGLYMESTGLDGMAPWSIVSNVMCVHPNFSRNLGAGIRTVNSANFLLGSFVNNAEGGIVAPDGLRVAAFCNGENTGESLFVVPYNGWGSYLLDNSASTNGVQAAAKWENGQWVTVGKPMWYCIDNAAKDVPQEQNTIAYYGDGTNQDKIAVLKP